MFLYGKHFSSMYKGSLVGKGFGAYALMGYVIANQQPGEDGVFRVDLNPVLLHAIFGEPEKAVGEAIAFLCEPDPNSQTPDEGGKRLVKEGPFLYRVVNGAMYAKIRNEEERREQNRLAQERYRMKNGGGVGGAKKKRRSRSTAKWTGGLPGEQGAVAAMERGEEVTVDRLAAERPPGEWKTEVQEPEEDDIPGLRGNPEFEP